MTINSSSAIPRNFECFMLHRLKNTAKTKRNKCLIELLTFDLELPKENMHFCRHESHVISFRLREFSFQIN